MKYLKIKTSDEYVYLLKIDNIKNLLKVSDNEYEFEINTMDNETYFGQIFDDNNKIIKTIDALRKLVNCQVKK